MRQLDDRVPDYLKRFIKRRPGKRQDIVSLLKLPVVAVTGHSWIDYPAADSGSGIRGIVDECRWTGGRGWLGVSELTIGLKVEHALVGCRGPFRQVAPLLAACYEDVDWAWPILATGSGEVFCQPVEGLFHADSGALGDDLDMGPRADGQADIDAAAPQALILFDHLINKPILPAFLQQDGDVNPLERLTQPHRSPQWVFGIRRREPLPVRHPAAREDRFLGTDERKLREPRLQASAGRHEAQNAPH